jgi:hypothetical protein
MTTATKPPAPIEHKTIAATWSTGLTSVILAALYGDTTNVDVSWLPTWAQTLAIAILPTLFTAWRTYAAAHTSRPDLAPSGWLEAHIPAGSFAHNSGTAVASGPVTVTYAGTLQPETRHSVTAGGEPISEPVGQPNAANPLGDH